LSRVVPVKVSSGSSKIKLSELFNLLFVLIGIAFDLFFFTAPPNEVFREQYFELFPEFN
jgi:hypothetical protein